MMIVQSPKKTPKKNQPKSPEKGARRFKPPPPPFFAPKNVAPSSAIPSSSPAFATPAHPLRPFQAPAPAKAAVLPILLPPATLRPLAFRTFTKKHSLTLTSTALQELATFIGRHCGSGWREEGLAEKVLEEVARTWKNCNGGVIVEGTSTELKDILKTLEGNMSGGKIIGLRPATMLSREDSQTSFGMSGMDFDEEPDDETLKDVRSWLKVINAFDQPRYTYNVAKKHFEKIASKPSLLPPASHKTEAFRNRYNVFHQRLLRNEAFQTSAVTSARSSVRRGASALQSHKITPISNLLGRHGTNHMLLGMLVILPTGKLAISDLTGTITLDLSHAVAIPEDSAWFTPGMIVLIDGVYEEEEESIGKGLSGSSGVGGTIGGRFQGFFIGQPPCEKRRATLGVSGLDGGVDHTVGGGFGWIDFLGVGSERAVGSRMRKLEQRLLRQPAMADPDSPGRGRVVIVGELNLDQPRSLQALRKILSLYATDPEGSTPMTFVLAGNFTTYAVMARGGSGGSIEYKEFFDALASTLADFPMLLTTATFVFVPGDNDGRLSLFGPNHEIVLFRDDISARLRRSSVRLKTKTTSGPQSSEIPHDTLTARKLVKTLLDQGYLCPFRQQVRPVHWDYAPAMYLYPLPTALVLIDTTAPAFCVTYEGCLVMNPGSVLHE
ncbi:DNA-directed DNA polymerase epsilon, subunit B [Collariella sp. IMI 366227]|nr:DNA-directed DNA polymerase epsilon, subunit B [Collariella sp. IMI 366227]